MWNSLQSEDSEATMGNKRLNSSCLVAVVLGAIVFFLLGFAIGWFSRPTTLAMPPNLNARKAFLTEMKAENIKEFLYNFTRLPHLAGTEQNLLLAKQIQDQWTEFGLDLAELTHYDVLLSYPNETNPNYISIIDEHGNEIFNTSLSESTPAGYENITDIVPPFNAYSVQGVPEGDLVYVNYARTEDFSQLEQELRVNCTGKIVIARYGKIFRGNKVKNAQLAGAKGLILFSDPADYSAPGVEPYPAGWNLPGDGVQRGNVLNLNGAGDPLTPGYPAKEYTFRYNPAEGVGLPKIPVHPIGYHDAERFLRNMGGPASPNTWKGNLNVSYNIGPGFKASYSTQKVRMHIHTNNKVTRIYNVIGTIKGAVEPGWRPRRTMIFASWDAEEFGLLGSTEWAEENAKILQKRGVAYINADSSVEGNYTLRVDCTPLMYALVYNLTKEIPSPDDSFEGKSLYESWHQKDNWTDYADAPRINKLGSGNDFEAFFQRLGIASGRARYTKNRKEGRYSGYPVYHSVYETFEIVEKFYDPTFRNHLTVTQVRGGLVFELADSTILPFHCQDYATALKHYADIIYTLAQKHEAQLATFKVSFDSLFSAVNNFSRVAMAFNQRVQNVDMNNLISVRSLNDQLMFLERAFIDPLGLPGRPFYRHIIFAPSSHNKYAGESFPGIYDALFDIENKADQKKAWEEVKRQISIATFTVQAAAETLQ